MSLVSNGVTGFNLLAPTSRGEHGGGASSERVNPNGNLF